MIAVTIVGAVVVLGSLWKLRALQRLRDSIDK